MKIGVCFSDVKVGAAVNRALVFTPVVEKVFRFFACSFFCLLPGAARDGE